MKSIAAFRRVLFDAESAADSLRALVAGLANQSDLLNRRFDQVVLGIENQSVLLNRKFDQVTAGLENVSDLLNRKFAQVIAGTESQSDLLNRKFDRVINAVSGTTLRLTPVETNGDGENLSGSQDCKVEIRDLCPIVDESELPAIDQAHDRARFINEAIGMLAHDHRSVSWGDRLLTLDKSADFKKEPAFSKALDTIRGSHSYDQYNGSDGIAWRLNTLVWAGRLALRTGGDFVECGTFKGDMAWVVLQAIGAERIPRFWLFDSFEGFSPDYSSADDFPDNPGFLDFANGFYRQAGLYEYVRDRFASFANVTLIKGFLPDTLDAATPARIGFLHIDLNSPRAEIAVLERLFERVLPGGVIVFDDYGWEMFHKQKKAEDDFMRRHGHEILELPTGQGLAIKR
jgi:O-methyltransferase